MFWPWTWMIVGCRRILFLSLGTKLLLHFSGPNFFKFKGTRVNPFANCCIGAVNFGFFLIICRSVISLFCRCYCNMNYISHYNALQAISGTNYGSYWSKSYFFPRWNTYIALLPFWLSTTVFPNSILRWITNITLLPFWLSTKWFIQENRSCPYLRRSTGLYAWNLIYGVFLFFPSPQLLISLPIRYLPRQFLLLGKKNHLIPSYSSTLRVFTLKWTPKSHHPPGPAWTSAMRGYSDGQSLHGSSKQRA